MRIIETEETDFVEKYEKDLKLAKKLTPELVKLLKDNFGNDLYKIDYKIKRVVFGSTWIKDEKTNTSQSYSSEKVVFILEFINKNYGEKIEIRRITFETIESFTPFDLTKYGCPLDIEFYNYEKKEF